VQVNRSFLTNSFSKKFRWVGCFSLNKLHRLWICPAWQRLKNRVYWKSFLYFNVCMRGVKWFRIPSFYIKRYPVLYLCWLIGKNVMYKTKKIGDFFFNFLCHFPEKKFCPLDVIFTTPSPSRQLRKPKCDNLLCFFKNEWNVKFKKNLWLGNFTLPIIEIRNWRLQKRKQKNP